MRFIGFSLSLLSSSLARSLGLRPDAWPSIIFVILMLLESSMSSRVLARLDECTHSVAQTVALLHVPAYS